MSGAAAGVAVLPNDGGWNVNGAAAYVYLYMYIINNIYMDLRLCIHIST